MTNLELPFISHNRDVKLEYKILKDKVREYNKKEAQFYSNIFAKMNKLEQTNSTVNRQNPNLFKSVVMVTLCLLLTVFLVYGVWYGNADGSKAGSNANDHR
jgi:FK506-binding protein 4/5